MALLDGDLGGDAAQLLGPSFADLIACNSLLLGALLACRLRASLEAGTLRNRLSPRSREALLEELGAKREEARARQHKEEATEAAQDEDRISAPGFSFTADLVVKDDDTGFELWIGSLEDRLLNCSYLESFLIYI